MNRHTLSRDIQMRVHLASFAFVNINILRLVLLIHNRLFQLRTDQESISDRFEMMCFVKPHNKSEQKRNRISGQTNRISSKRLLK